MTFGEAIVKFVVAPFLVLAMLPVLLHLAAWALAVVTISILSIGGAVALVTYLYKTAIYRRSVPADSRPAFPPTPVERPKPPRRTSRW